MDELQPIEAQPRQGNKIKFIIGGVVIVAAIIYLMVSSLSANVQYFLTVEELVSKQVTGEITGRNVRASGAVLGDSIQYDMDTLELSFTIVHVPGDNQLLEQEGGLASALHNAVMDPGRPSIEVVYYGAIPDLLQNEAQAIITGKVLASGVFEADEILLKCPTKYEGSVPDQIESES
ncbi:MAG: cytochrome c maturation protein CcmE [Anaerolineales bacterium]|nr:cytochrome c maturation protein CcmE [Anaerolineales bacterium]